MDPWLEKELKKIKRRIPKERKQKLDLNMQLLEICRAETINYEKVEDLLRQGAEPLGYIVESDGWPDNLYSVVQEHLYRGCDTGEDFYSITELFLRYGMDIGKPAVPYDREWVLNPISSYLGVKNDCMLRTMRLLLDHGLRAEDAAEGWGTQIEDLLNMFWNFSDPQLQLEYPDYVRLLMLTAAYPHILEKDEWLRKDIWYEHNRGRCELKRFREWAWYDIEVDTTRCETVPQLACSLTKIRDKKTQKVVWEFGIHLDPACV